MRPAPASQVSVDAIGIDLGLKNKAVIHDGVASRKVVAAEHLAARQKRLRRYQRSYPRQRDAAMVRQGLDPAKRIPKGTRIAVSNRMRRRTYRTAMPRTTRRRRDGPALRVEG